MALCPRQHILHVGFGRVGLDDCRRLLGKERLALLLAVGRDALRSRSQSVKNFGKANLLVADAAVDFLSQPVGTHYIPGAAPFGGVPQRFQFQKSLVMKVASLVENDERLCHRADEIDEVLLNVVEALHIVQAELFGDVADELVLALDLRAINVNHVFVGAGVLAGSVGLANASLVAQKRPAACLLAE